MSVFPGAIPPTGSASASSTLAVAGHTALHNTEYNEINAIATKVGTGASTPTSGMVLRGSGAGTSAWAQTNLTSDVTGVLPQANGGTGGNAAILAVIYPIGCIYIETTGTNPVTTFGFGTWVSYGAGQTMIGVGTSDQVFAAGVTGGESNHALVSNEMPSHTHIQDAHSHALLGGTVAGGNTNGFLVGTSSAGALPGNVSTTATNQNTGGGATHNNLPPYIVTYFWKRTA